MFHPLSDPRNSHPPPGTHWFKGVINHANDANDCQACLSQFKRGNGYASRSRLANQWEAKARPGPSQTKGWPKPKPKSKAKPKPKPKKPKPKPQMISSSVALQRLELHASGQKKRLPRHPRWDSIPQSEGYTLSPPEQELVVALNQ